MTFRLILMGSCAEGLDIRDVRRKFMSLTGQTEAVASRLLSGHSTVIRRGLERPQAEGFVQALSDIGALARFEEELAEPVLLLDPEVTQAVPAVPEPAARPSSRPPIAVLPPGVEQQALYAAALGPKNADYYQAYFAERDAGGRWVSWNWPAFFVFFQWALYRKLWWFAFWGILLACAVAVVPTFLVPALLLSLKVSKESVQSINLLMPVVGCIGPAMLANEMVYRRAKRLIAETSRITDPQRRLRDLTQRGGTSQAWLWVGIGGIFLIAVLGVVLAIAIPAYLDRGRQADAAANNPADPAASQTDPTPGKRPSIFDGLESTEPTPGRRRSIFDDLESSEQAAAQKAEEARAAVANDPNSLLRSLAAAYGEGRFEAAWAIANKVAALPGPAASHGMNIRGLIAMENRRFDLAQKYFTEALERCERCAVIQSNLGFSYQAQGRHKEAVAAFNRALGLDSTIESASHGRASSQAILAADAKQRAWEQYKQQHLLPDCGHALSLSGTAQCLKEQNELRARLGY